MLMPWAEAVSLPKAQRLIVTREVFYVLFVVCKSMLAGEGGCRCRGYRAGTWVLGERGHGQKERGRRHECVGCRHEGQGVRERPWVGEGS